MVLGPRLSWVRMRIIVLTTSAPKALPTRRMLSVSSSFVPMPVMGLMFPAAPCRKVRGRQCFFDQFARRTGKIWG